MKKFFALAIAVMAISCVGCSSQSTEEVEALSQEQTVKNAPAVDNGEQEPGNEHQGGQGGVN